MAASWHGALLLGMASAGIEVEHAAGFLIDEGVGPEELVDIEQFIRELDLDPSARDRAMLLLERTRLLAERGAVGARASNRLRADAAGEQTLDLLAAVGGLGGLLRHELSTPLAAAHLALETLASRRDDPAIVERMVQVARRNLRLASHLVNGLSSLEGLQTGQVELSWTQIDLGELVRECAEDVGALHAGEHEIDVAACQTIQVPADRDAVQHVVVNLLTNAVKFTPKGSPITVTVSTTSEYAQVAVRDHGPGIARQEAESIFEAGQRLSAAGPGMGLGLFIARLLARAHGGDLTLQHPPGGGARFVLRLPLSPAESQHSLERREQGSAVQHVRARRRADIADARDATLAEREATADARDDTLAEREATADARDDTLAEREATAGQRDAERHRGVDI